MYILYTHCPLIIGLACYYLQYSTFILIIRDLFFFLAPISAKNQLIKKCPTLALMQHVL